MIRFNQEVAIMDITYLGIMAVLAVGSWLLLKLVEHV